MSTLPPDACFYAILDTGYVSRDRWRETAQALIEGGADLIQVRAKLESPDEREALVQEILPLFARSASSSGAHPLLVVNDDVDLCARTPGAGLHVGQDDVPPAEARRRIGPDRILGWSTHSWPQAREAMRLPTGLLSYFCVGPLFATPTKPDYEPVGLALAARVAAADSPLPWFAIGGIKLNNLASVLAAGARRIVVVSEVLQAPRPATVVRQLRAAVTHS